MYLLRTGLAAVFEEHPQLEPHLAVQLALTRINSRPLSGAADISRRSVHFGRDLPPTELAVILHSLPTPPLSPELAPFYQQRNIAAAVNARHDALRVRRRVVRALQSRAPALPVLVPGDYYLYWHKGRAKRDRGWRGPVVHVGMVGTNTLGYYRGVLVSTHRSRVHRLDSPARKLAAATCPVANPRCYGVASNARFAAHASEVHARLASNA